MNKEYGQRHHTLLNSEIRKSVTRLFKQYLASLEDIQYSHNIAVDKLKDQLSPENLDTLDYLSDDHYSLVRKRILDAGNESMRDLSDLLDNFHISLNDSNSLGFEDRDQDRLVIKAINKQGYIYEEETE